MKKIYQIPETMVHMIAPATLIAESLPTGDDDIIDNPDDILVKRDHGSNSSNYNVWNDDWQKP